MPPRRSDLRAGSAGTLTIEAVADGATAAQMPELQLPPIDGVQVFAEPVQADETFRDGRPRVKLTRRFSLVPSRAGAARLTGLRIDWWDVTAGAARSASLPALSWPVAAAPTDRKRAPALPSDGYRQCGGHATDATDSRHASRLDAGGAAVRGVVAGHTGVGASITAVIARWLRTRAAAGRSARMRRGGRDSATLADLKRALDTGDLGEVADMLCAMATPPRADIDDCSARLDDPAQRDAIDALQRARWGGATACRARQLLRNAFAKGPRWRAVAAVAKPSPLPPLYPPADSTDASGAWRPRTACWPRSSTGAVMRSCRAQQCAACDSAECRPSVC